MAYDSVAKLRSCSLSPCPRCLQHIHWYQGSTIESEPLSFGFFPREEAELNLSSSCHLSLSSHLSSDSYKTPPMGNNTEID